MLNSSSAFSLDMYISPLTAEYLLEDIEGNLESYLATLTGEDYTPANNTNFSLFDLRCDTDAFTYDAEDDGRTTLSLPLLPHQIALMDDIESKIIGLISGYGAGKTYIVARKALQLASLNPGCDGIITEPNFPLLGQILIPEMHAALQQAEVSYVFKSSENIFYVEIEGKTTRIICKSMERFDRLIGINAAWIIADEFDTTKAEIAYQAFLKLLGRLRAGKVRQFIITTTPEGFGAAHKVFEEEKRGRLIRAKTTDNIFLPQDFIDNLYEMYPANLVKAYIEGLFVNLQGNPVYPSFDRRENHADVELSGGEDIHVGIDFNIGGCAVKSSIMVNDEVFTFDEYLGKDTHDVGRYLAETFGGHHVYFYPDASGNKGTTNASESDIQILQSYGLVNMGPKSNPRIRDRVLSVDNGFRHKKLWVDTAKCPDLTNSLERQAYDKTETPEKFPGPGTIDDHNDAFGYKVHRLMPITKPSFLYKN